jgi:hypothetical protein
MLLQHLETSARVQIPQTQERGDRTTGYRKHPVLMLGQGWDLIGLAAIWRILLFMGFGAVLLLLSYSFRSLWKPSDKSDHGSDR